MGRRVLREHVKDVLLQRIVRGELQAGERLVESRIAQELGTSQAPVREALRDLEQLRLVESVPYKGARVRALDDDELVEIAPVRMALESLAARLATEALDGDVSALEAELEAMREAAAAGDLTALVRHDFAFHRVLVDAAGNAALSTCWRTLGVEGRITLSIYGPRVAPDEAAELHVPILEAVRSGDGAAAAREARKHVEHFARLVARPGRG